MKKMRRFVFLLLVAALFILAACSGGSTGSGGEHGLVPPLQSTEPHNPPLAGAAAGQTNNTLPPLCNGAQDANAAAYATEVIRLVNVERTNAGLGSLASQAQLTQAAQRHSIDMGCNFFLSHTGSDGSDPFDRIDASGYYWYTAGENVAGGYSTPAAVVTAWMNSAGHRANILSTDFTEIGIGYIYNPNDTTNQYYHYWTMTLGSQ
jgi:uncharacterized protein YkwD